MADVVLATGRKMPRATPENALLVASLARLGVEARVRPWDEPSGWETPGMVVGGSCTPLR